MTTIRKNAKPRWFKIGNSYCVGCGTNFYLGELILSGLYCSSCRPIKELEFCAKEREIKKFEYRDSCVKCAQFFKKGDEALFGKYCNKCGLSWIKERKIRQPRLRKAPGLKSKNN